MDELSRTYLRRNQRRPGPAALQGEKVVSTNWRAAGPGRRASDSSTFLCLFASMFLPALTLTAGDAFASADRQFWADADIGGEVTDWTTGVVDFPAVSDAAPGGVAGGREIRLCWRYGEPAVTHWHTEDEGCARRREIATLAAEPAAALDLAQ